jgi:hypothetical protein
MSSYYIMFVLPFNDSNKEDSHNSDFKNIYKPKKKTELNLNKEILLFKNNILDSNSELKEGTSFINIKEYLVEMALIEPLELPSIKIPILISDRPIPILKSRAIPNNRTKI